MIRFYLNRELSASLGIRLSRWKRWSREFLPPDPLGGLQSGFARQYSLSEAFQVYLGGHLVADLKFSVPDSKVIVGDLKDWVMNQYFSYPPSEEQSSIRKSVKEYRIYIFTNLELKQASRKHAYLVRRVIDREKSHGKGARIVTERYIENWLEQGDAAGGYGRPEDVPYWMAARILYITKIYHIFKEALQKEEK